MLLENRLYTVRFRRSGSPLPSLINTVSGSTNAVLNIIDDPKHEIVDLRLNLPPALLVVDLAPLVDLALATNDREWFNELTGRKEEVAM